MTKIAWQELSDDEVEDIDSMVDKKLLSSGFTEKKYILEFAWAVQQAVMQKNGIGDD
jgi:hypothetical protein